MNRTVLQVSLRVGKSKKGELFEEEEDTVFILWEEEDQPFPHPLCKGLTRACESQCSFHLITGLSNHDLGPADHPKKRI